MNLKNFLADCKPNQLVALYNMLVPAKPIAKFESRSVAESRVLVLIQSQGTYVEFFGDYAAEASKAGIELPAPRKSKVVELPEAKVSAPASTKKAPAAKKEESTTGPTAKAEGDNLLHLPKIDRSESKWVRCPKCGYTAKTFQQMLDIARIKCPVHDVAMLTALERQETRGKYGRTATATK